MMERDKINAIVSNLDHKPEISKELVEIYDKLIIDGAKSYQKLQDGRNYLMQVESDKITVEDTLDAFGFGRNGLGE